MEKNKDLSGGKIYITTSQFTNFTTNVRINAATITSRPNRVLNLLQLLKGMIHQQHFEGVSYLPGFNIIICFRTPNLDQCFESTTNDFSHLFFKQKNSNIKRKGILIMKIMSQNDYKVLTSNLFKVQHEVRGCSIKKLKKLIILKSISAMLQDIQIILLLYNY